MIVEFDTYLANASDVDDIASAHRDSIRSIGPQFYPLPVVNDWEDGVSSALYLSAMEAGEVFYIAKAKDGEPAVLGFASDYSIDGPRHGASVYVRGMAARRGVGSALLKAAEAHAVGRGATSIEIEASRAGVDFYRAHAFIETGRGETYLRSGRPIGCVFMRKNVGAAQQFSRPVAKSPVIG
jgi:GNAT superfamily N-acetyltransferase